MPRKDGNFSKEEMIRIRLAISHLEEFHAGYKLQKELEAAGHFGQPAFRFIECALITFAVGCLPQSREQGLIPIYRLVGFADLADEVTRCLDQQLGDATLAKILHDYRSVAIAHQTFRLEPYRRIREHLENNLADENEGLYLETWDDLKKLLAGSFLVFEKFFPELVADAREASAEFIHTGA